MYSTATTMLTPYVSRPIYEVLTAWAVSLALFAIAAGIYLVFS